MKQNTICMFVSGPLACFTRPVMKVERVSYPCMTPSAARGCLEAILWKPQFRWVVHRITVLQPIQFFSVRRNEIQDKIKPNDLGKWMKSPESYTPYYFDSAGRKSPYGEHRVQRHTLALRDVAYIIQAGIELTQKANQPRKNPLDVDEPAGPDTVIKYVAMFKRRLEKGQCFQQPYLGLREFVADFHAPNGETPPPDDPALGAEEYDLGRMFYDYRYPQADQDYEKAAGKKRKKKSDTPRPVALFAPAKLAKGVLDVDAMRATAQVEEAYA